MRPFFLLLLLMSCQVKQEADKSLKTTSTHIINGTKLSHEERDLAQAGVALFYGGSSCSGILISPNVILSAGHCFPTTAFNASDIEVYIGSESPTSATSKSHYEVEKVITHPVYVKSSIDADLAVIILKDDVSNNYRPLELFDGNDYLAVAEPLVVAGFSPFSKPLRNSIYDFFTEKYRHDYKISNSERRSLFKKRKNLLSRKVIMMSDGLDGYQVDDAIYMAQLSGGICSGDSGGPTMAKRGGKHYLVGINRAVQLANNLKESDCEFVSISTSVYFYKDWIDETITKNNGELPTWTLPREDVNFREKKCADVLTRTVDIYFALAKPTPEFCQQISFVDVAQELKNMNQACETICGDLKGFEGQCSFLSRGNADMIKLNKSLCSKGT